MTTTRGLFLASLLAASLASLTLRAQTNGCNSSYSRFGLGTMNDQSQGFNRAMGGVAQGIASGQKVNMLNPASYASIDSLTFIFDVGMGVQYGHFKQGGSTTNARNTNLEYVNAGFHIARRMGMSFGFVPYSTIGYNFTSDTRVGSNYTSSQTITSETTYYGNGGLHQMYLGIGWTPFAKLSVGANISYIWGDFNHSLAQTFYEGSTTSSSYSTLNSEWTSDVRTYKLDIGLQYPVRLTPQDWLTLGATVSIGHGIGSEVQMIRYTSLKDTIESTRKNAFDLPYTVSVGGAWQHKGKLIVAADYTFEKWEGCRIPVSRSTSTESEIEVRTDQYLNRHRVNVGAEYTPNPLARNYTPRIRYRVGAYFATPYTKVNGENGPQEYSVTAGIALPLSNAGKSVVNVSVQWLKRRPGTAGMISENYFMAHLGVTFNERWFMKWKFN
ncbi:MAG: hypothetical protein LUI09_03885 [Prevotellaceae bacterium]|nr:hypothetical protein [Prevotellaceae bacterium]